MGTTRPNSRSTRSLETTRKNDDRSGEDGCRGSAGQPLPLTTRKSHRSRAIGNSQKVGLRHWGMPDRLACGGLWLARRHGATGGGARCRCLVAIGASGGPKRSTGTCPGSQAGRNHFSDKAKCDFLISSMLGWTRRPRSAAGLAKGPSQSGNGQNLKSMARVPSGNWLEFARRSVQRREAIRSLDQRSNWPRAEKVGA
jgi:hypothetical protein